MTTTALDKAVGTSHPKLVFQEHIPIFLVMKFREIDQVWKFGNLEGVEQTLSKRTSEETKCWTT